MSKRTKIVSWIFSGLTLLFLLMDAFFKLIKSEEAVKGTVELGYSESLVIPLGILLLVCSVLYLIPRTSFIGAIVLTGYFGGAVATHLRLGNPLFSHILFTVYLGVFVWVGLALRTPKLKSLIFNGK